jgi:hypothetical protein
MLQAQIATAAFTSVTAIATAWMAYLLKRQELRVEEVKLTLTLQQQIAERKFGDLRQVVGKTHALVNSAMLEQKRQLAKMARSKADITPNPVFLAEAEAAEEAYNRHLAEQEASGLLTLDQNDVIKR